MMDMDTYIKFAFVTIPQSYYTLEQLNSLILSILFSLIQLEIIKKNCGIGPRGIIPLVPIISVM